MITDVNARKHLHLSFHPSGVVNYLDARSARPDWRSLLRAQQLCAMIWEHPKGFPAAIRRHRDLVLRYPVCEAKPIFGSLAVVPLGQLALLPEAEFQQIIECSVIGRQPVPRLTVQLALAHGMEGQWPAFTPSSLENAGASQDGQIAQLEGAISLVRWLPYSRGRRLLLAPQKVARAGGVEKIPPDSSPGPPCRFSLFRRRSAGRG